MRCYFRDSISKAATRFATAVGLIFGFCFTCSAEAPHAVSGARAAVSTPPAEMIKDPNELFRQAFDAMQTGDLDNSKILFEAGLSIAPNDAKGHFYYGELLSRQGQSYLADQQYSLAAKLGGTGPIAEKAKAKLPSTYQVRPGDTVFSIALDHGFNYRDIIAYNHMDISSGVSEMKLPTTLLIPPSGYKASGP